MKLAVCFILCIHICLEAAAHPAMVAMITGVTTGEWKFNFPDSSMRISKLRPVMDVEIIRIQSICVQDVALNTIHQTHLSHNINDVHLYHHIQLQKKSPDQS